MIAKHIRTIYNALLIFLFMGLLAAPAVRMLGSEKMVFSFTEKRLLNAFPALPDSFSQPGAYFADIEAYLNDHFGFRDFLIYRYQREVRKRFGTVGDEGTAHQGIDNWFYFGQAEMLLDFAGRLQVSDAQLKQRLEAYQTKKQWLEQRGIKYLLVVAPDKQSVYPEFVMESWRKVQGRSKLQQFSDALPEISRQELLDLASELKKHKEEPLFYQSDTHWTPFGAFTAYLVIAEKLEQLFPSVSMRKEYPFTELQTRTCTSRENRCGDLTRMLLDFEPFNESFRKLAPFASCSRKIPFDFSLANLSAEEQRLSFTTQCSQAELTAVVFRDSFFVGLEPFFSENFAQAVYLWKAYDQRTMEELSAIFKPDIVIEEIVERNFILD